MVYEIKNYIDEFYLNIADARGAHGLTPDLLSIIIVVANQARGEVLNSSKRCYESTYCVSGRVRYYSIWNVGGAKDFRSAESTPRATRDT